VWLRRPGHFLFAQKVTKNASKTALEEAQHKADGEF
jgi:hypothetical protein